jgi:hypothetical protein
MATPLQIVIKGLALCFTKKSPDGLQDVWHVLFASDQLHPLTYIVNGTKVDDLRKGKDLNITLECSDFGSSSFNPGNFDSLLNLSNDVYAHGQTAGVSNLKISKRGTAVDMIRLQVPNAKMTVSDLIDVDILQVRPLPQKPKRVVDRGKTITLDLETNAPLTVRVRDTSSVETFSHVPAAAAGRIVLEFDNGCGRRCTHNDFEDLYSIVRHDTAQGEVRFLTWDADSVQSYEGDGTIVGNALETSRMSPEYGNCDPSSLNPPPSD